MNARSNIISSITNVLKNQEDIVFVYLFGSFVSKEKYQDIDIAIYTSNDHSLLFLGEIQTELEMAVGRKIDIIHLNNIISQNPALAHEIVSKGLIVVDKEPLTQKNFKEKALISHFDNAALNRQMQEAFRNRIRNRKIGVRNYAK
ncbi:nucleotidyltransferase domain-containing protein [Bacteroidales bacterium M08MB]|nr:nucleotidyltransferase domain-containing protein [Perlabentimonas gracilis]